MAPSDYSLAVLLRMIGAAELAALAFVFAPVGWMDAVHDRFLGLGPLPSGPIIEYLARHLSALYAVHGAMIVGISLDLTRYRPLAVVLGWSHVGLGPALGWTDWSAGFHWVWALGEGMVVSCCGGLIVAFARCGKLAACQRHRPAAVGEDDEGIGRKDRSWPDRARRPP
jgi:hypothetical protein